MIGLVGKKIGMTRIFTKEGTSISVTIIEVQENHIVQVKTVDVDNYNAIQVTTGTKKNNKLVKSEIGHFLRSGVKIGRGLWEFRVEKNISDFQLGKSINLNLFLNVKKVDVVGKSKGKGFCGTVKRWNFRTQDSSHGNSLSHRAPGSIGQNQTPGRVFKGKKMAGHLGNSRVTVQNLNVIRIDLKRNLLLLKGSVPGPKGSDLIIKPAIKVKGVKNSEISA
ncbi:50S ribosomal protein L3 [Buchnera aphidicola (Schlechtendalia chinensis)]|uniref:Large ribosomal subunit protein uL3 n=1 Tax=Buchnera aphidicola subsp. Schlechtendalia chinensis TaxID=118110 RepID=A0A172WE78_BUCSC|nr:50S ribosomal protein L3 [Buchnera aphidicola]ANF17225.1 50S ribosomal protein L3 [Buchnera aphidicola (Schlechtendalia chinensis)]